LKSVCVAILFLCVLDIHAQSNKDSLLRVYKNKSLPDTVRLEALYTLAFDAYLWSNPDTAVTLGKLIYNGAKKIGNKRYMSNGLNVQGIALYLVGEYNKAISAHKRCLALRKETGDKLGMVNSLNNIAIVYKDEGNYARAVEYYNLCLQTARREKNKPGIGNALNDGKKYASSMAGALGNLGVIYSDIDYKKALAFYTESLFYQKQVDNKSGEAIVLHSIGELYTRKGRLDKAKKYLEKSIELSREVNDLYDYGNALTSLGTVFAAQKDYKKALNYYEEALKALGEIGNKKGICVTYNSMAEAYFKSGEEARAVDYAKKSLEVARESGVILTMREASDILYRCYIKKGDKTKALEMLQLFVQLDDSVNSENTKRAFIENDFRNAYNKKVTADSLKRIHEKQVADEKSKARQKQEQIVRNALFGGLTLTLVFGIFMFNRFRITRRQKNIITEQKAEVEKQKHLVEEKQQEVMDSLHYAKRIQRSQMPQESYVDRVMKRLRKK
jgi:tetratricopeptide (TPR) repeat protein